MHRPMQSLLLMAVLTACAADAPAPSAPSASALSRQKFASHSEKSHDNPGRGFDKGAHAVDLAALTRVTAPFHRFDAARAAGWSTRITGCMSDPVEGGMGYHYGNTELIDGEVRPDAPELLLYEPQKNGQMKLVAVEYIVPLTEWHDSEPPKLFGQPFHINEEFEVWVLHVWLWQTNPSGFFHDWNPTVSCRWAASSPESR